MSENTGREPELIDEAETTPESKPRRIFIVVAAFAIIAVIGIAVLVWRFSGDDQAGKPVSAPRAFAMDEPTGGTFSGQTLTINPDQVERAGIKIETVGEQLSTESGAMTSTGVVQANSYRDTPVVSVAGGIVRRVTRELGDNVERGQTIAVIFSNEFADAQSRYLALSTEAKNARRNFERAEKLVVINQPGRSEFEQAARQLKAAEAALDEMKKRYQRTAKLVQIGASSREDFEQDTTKLRTAEAEAAETHLRLDRSKKLLDINPQTRAELEESANKLQSAESDLASSRQKLLLYGMAPSRLESLRSASQITSEIAVPAPVSGTVTARMVNVGEVVEAGKEMLRVTDLSNIWVTAQVYEKDLASLRNESGASVTSEAFPDRLFRGQITYIDPKLDPATRTAQVRVELQNPDRALKIGMYVGVAFGAQRRAEQTVPVVPASAIQNLGSQQIVFAATNEPNVFELRPVRLSSENNGQFQVLEGLTVGDKIVTEGSFLLRAEWIKQHPDGQ